MRVVGPETSGAASATILGLEGTKESFQIPPFESIGEALGRTGGGDEAGSAGGVKRRSIDGSPEPAAMPTRTSGHGSEERADRSRQRSIPIADNWRLAAQEGGRGQI